jgi:hypothetical protein
MKHDRLRLELRAITVSLDAALRTVSSSAADGPRLQALALLDRLESKIAGARLDGSNGLTELDALAEDLAAARLAIEGAQSDAPPLPSMIPVDPD